MMVLLANEFSLSGGMVTSDRDTETPLAIFKKS